MKYILLWNIGFGANEEIIEADSLDEALQIARDYAFEDFENNVTWNALELTPSVAEEYGYEDELDE